MGKELVLLFGIVHISLEIQIIGVVIITIRIVVMPVNLACVHQVHVMKTPVRYLRDIPQNHHILHRMPGIYMVAIFIMA